MDLGKASDRQIVSEQMCNVLDESRVLLQRMRSFRDELQVHACVLREQVADLHTQSAVCGPIAGDWVSITVAVAVALLKHADEIVAVLTAIIDAIERPKGGEEVK